jgi:hypothetical protein
MSLLLCMSMYCIHELMFYTNVYACMFFCFVMSCNMTYIKANSCIHKTQLHIKLELWVTSLSDTPRLQYYHVQTLEYRNISKLPMKNERTCISSCKKVRKCWNPHVYWWIRIGFKQSHFVEDLVVTPRCMSNEPFRRSCAYKPISPYRTYFRV